MLDKLDVGRRRRVGLLVTYCWLAGLGLGCLALLSSIACFSLLLVLYIYG
jgi:hypothetical protein